MTGDDELPAAIAQFVTLNLDSVAELEALLLVHGTSGERWDAHRLARRLYITDPEATAVLHKLRRRGFVSHDEAGFRYLPQAEALRLEVDALAAAYPRFLIAITQLIHAKPRTALREFSDAFRFREEK
jgi:hypothetical protein